MKKTIELTTTSDGIRATHYLHGAPDNRYVGEIHLRKLERHGFPSNLPDGTKVTLTIDIPRQKGWYPAIMNDESKKLIYWNGEEFRSGTGNRNRFTCSWGEDEYKWVAGDPIPDPFGETKQ